jgi:aminoglycoside phosphotransferase (APT) family kinase protein
LIDRLSGFAPEDTRLCHGDFQPGNILGPSGEPLVIDWVDAVAGDAEADACRSYLLLHTVSPPLAKSYLDAYAEGSASLRAEILAWLPFVAAARLAEAVEGEGAELSRLARPDLRDAAQAPRNVDRSSMLPYRSRTENEEQRGPDTSPWNVCNREEDQ